MIRFVLAAISILFAVAFAVGAHAQSMIAKPSHYLTTTTTNSTLVFAGPVLLQWIMVVNPNAATQLFLKLYNKATAPVCGTDPVVMNIPIPAANNGGGALSVGTEGAQFPNGLGFCLTANIADNDSAAATGTSVALNFGVVPQ